MDENEFWLGVWKLVAGVICTIAICMSVESIKAKHDDAELIKAGANPLDVVCRHGHADKSMCITRATRP